MLKRNPHQYYHQTSIGMNSPIIPNTNYTNYYRALKCPIFQEKNFLADIINIRWFSSPFIIQGTKGRTTWLIFFHEYLNLIVWFWNCWICRFAKPQILQYSTYFNEAVRACKGRHGQLDLSFIAVALNLPTLKCCTYTFISPCWKWEREREKWEGSLTYIFIQIFHQKHYWMQMVLCYQKFCLPMTPWALSKLECFAG